MNQTLDQLSNAELIALLGVREKELESKDERIGKLEGLLARFQKMLFGQKRERFESADQLSLPFETTTEDQQTAQQELTEKVAYIRRKSASAHPGQSQTARTSSRRADRTVSGRRPERNDLHR